MPNHNPASARMSFQWKYLEMVTPQVPPTVLNIGSADDPVKFGELAWHFDIDDWSCCHKYFTQGDAHALPFEDGRFDMVIMGDIMEHLVDPAKAVSEAMRVIAVGGILVMTVFEEWRLPGYGQWIQEGLAKGDAVSQSMGYLDRQDYQVKNFPERKGFDDDSIPHLVHINQFTDEDMNSLATNIIASGWETIELVKAYEATQDGHDWYNWLMAFRRII